MVTSLASDGFTGANGDPWSSAWANGQLSTGASFQIQSNVGRVTTANLVGGVPYTGASTQKVNLSNPTNQVWLMKFRWPTGDECYPGVWMRASNDILDAAAGYCFELNRPGSNWKVFKTTSGVATDLATASFTFTSNTWYWVRCGIVDDDLKFKLWADGVSEPGAWTWAGTDATYAGAGRCGLRVGPGGVGNAKFEIDDFNLDDDFQLSFSDTAVLSGSGALTKSVIPRPTATPGPSGAGTLTAAGVPAIPATVALAGAGALTTTRTPAMPGAAALTGSGSLAVTGTPAVTGAAAALAGAGSLSVGGAPALLGTATRTGSGTLTISAGPAPADTADRTGSGTLTAAGVPKPVVTAVMDAEGQLAVALTPAIPGAAAQTGIGVLAVDVLPGLTGTVTRTGSGALVASGVPTPAALPALSGSGTLAFAGVIGFSGSAGPAGVGALTTSRTPALPGTATLAGSGALTASGVPKPVGSVALSGAGGLVAVGTPHLPGTAVLAGAGALTVAVVPKPAVTLALASTGTLTLARTPAIPGTVGLTGVGALVVALSGQRGERGTARLGAVERRIRLGPDDGGSSGRSGNAVLSGMGALFAEGVLGGSDDWVGVADLAGAGALAVGGSPGWAAEAVLTGAGALTAPGVPALLGLSGMGGAGQVAAVGVPGLLAAAVLTGAGGVSAAGTPAIPGTAGRTGAGVLAAVGTPSVPIAYRGSATGTNGAGTGTSITVTIPAGVQVGDGMLIVHTTRSATGATDTMSTPAGWTAVDTQAKNNTQSVLYKRVAQGGDAGSNVTLAGSATTGRVAVLVAYSGVHADIIDVETSALDQVSGTVHTMPALAANSLADWSVEFCSDRSGPASTSFTISGSSYTSRQTIVGGGSSSVTSSVADTNGVISSLSLGGETWTGTSANANTIMYVVALKAASA